MDDITQINGRLSAIESKVDLLLDSNRQAHSDHKEDVNRIDGEIRSIKVDISTLKSRQYWYMGFFAAIGSGTTLLWNKVIG